MSKVLIAGITNLETAMSFEDPLRPGYTRISAHGTCDWCDEIMTHAGASKDGLRVVRSCNQHLEAAKARLEEPKDE